MSLDVCNPAALYHPSSIILVYVTDSGHQQRLDHQLPDVISNIRSIFQDPVSYCIFCKFQRNAEILKMDLDGDEKGNLSHKHTV